MFWCDLALGLASNTMNELRDLLVGLPGQVAQLFLWSAIFPNADTQRRARSYPPAFTSLFFVVARNSLRCGGIHFLLRKGYLAASVNTFPPESYLQMPISRWLL